MNAHMRGIGLVELMVALLLGLFIVGGVINLFVANRQAFRSTEQLTRLQESARVSFELMARSLREAGGSNCGRNLPTANVINNASNFWWADWDAGLRGYEGNQAAPAVGFGTAAAQRINGTDAFFSIHADGNSGASITNHDTASAQFTLSSAAHGLQAGHLALACDYRRAALFQVSSVAGAVVGHNTAGASPGNCVTGLGMSCAGTPTTYAFQAGGTLNGVASETWYVGANGRNGRSLYRARLTRNAAGNAEVQFEEIAEGVHDMQLTYLQMNADGSLPADYQAANAITDWTRVVATRIVLTLRSNEAVGTDGAVLERRAYHVVSLRNRLP
ncbi:MAG: PilW family protein [Caldimonas manganoxidans]|nr:PilW family protein [Caldimonas manganoxidans]